MKHLTRLCALLLCAAVTLSLAGCLSRDQVMGVVAPTEAPEEEPAGPVGERLTEEESDERRVVCTAISGNFNPFTATLDGDKAVVNATQLPLRGLEGEESPCIISSVTNDDGSCTVSIELRGGLRFADGESINADDLLFTYYVLLDPDYQGESAVRSLPIPGVEDYYHGVNVDLYEKYGKIFDEIYNGGKYDEKLQKALREAQEADPKDYNAEYAAQKAVDEYDNDKAADIRNLLQQAWRQDAAGLVKFCMRNYAATVEYHTGYTLEQLKENPGLQIMYAMVETSFGSLTEEGVLVGKKTGRTWDLKGSFPTEEDFYKEMYESYGGSAETYWQIEGIGRGDLVATARDMAIRQWSQQDEEWDGGVRRISGIERVGDRLIRITLEHYEPTYMDTLCDVYLVPLHYYGDESLYDYFAGSYGFPFGDLSGVEEAGAGETMGAGAYVLSSFDGSTARLGLNGNFWTGYAGEETLIVSTDAN